MVLTWNAGAEAIKGYRPDEIIGSHFSRFYPRDKIETGWPQHELVCAAEAGRFEDEGWRVRKDGSLFWASVVITAIRDGERRLVAFAKITRDLSDRRAHEEELRMSEERFRSLVSDVKDYAIFMVDIDGHITSWNAGAGHMHGYTADEIIGSHISRFYEPDAVKRGWAEHELRMATMEGRFEDEGWRVRKDGARFWASVIITAMRDRKGALVGFSKITRDLTERRRHEQELADSEERFRMLVQGVSDYSIIMLDHGGFISSWNSGAQALTGFTADEMLGKHFSHFYSSECVRENKPWQHLLAANESGRASEEGWRLRKDGTQFWADSVITALVGPDKRHRGYVHVMHDLSDRRHAETLADTTQRMHEFIAMLAHELRNPLAPIRNAAELLSRKDLKEESREAMRQVIERQAGHLAQIVDELLDVNRIVRGKFSIMRSAVDFNDVLGRAIETSRPLIDKQGQHLVFSPRKEPLLLQGDSLRLTQVFVNLLNNAAKFTPAGGTITVGVVRRKTDVEVTVSDTGRGIAAQDLERVFDLFVQANPANSEQGGLGVGLALVRRVVELHAGSVRAQSGGTGKGSAFVVRLPLPVEALTLVSGEVRSADGELPRYRIVIADDNRDAADSLHLLLQSFGQDPYTVYDGTTALEAIDRLRPHIVMLDIGMPGMSGYQVVESMRSRYGREMPVLIAITGWGTLKDKSEAFARGFDYHFSKPASAASLQSTLAEIASRIPPTT
jgi:PAS domain S-box-containing protein